MMVFPSGSTCQAQAQGLRGARARGPGAGGYAHRDPGARGCFREAKHRGVVKHFSAVDLFSRFSLAVVHSRAAGFLRGLVLRVFPSGSTRAPFPVRAIQVDGGSEFMAEFEAACQGLGIQLFVLPPRSPKLNGHVERIQRTFQDEFYTRPLPRRVAELQVELDAYLA